MTRTPLIPVRREELPPCFLQGHGADDATFSGVQPCVKPNQAQGAGLEPERWILERAARPQPSPGTGRHPRPRFRSQPRTPGVPRTPPPVPGLSATGVAPGSLGVSGPLPRHSLGDLGVEVPDPEAVPVLQGALAQDGRVLQRQRLAARLHGGAGRTGTGPHHHLPPPPSPPAAAAPGPAQASPRPRRPAVT